MRLVTSRGAGRKPGLVPGHPRFREHGGGLDAVTAPGQGATVTVRMPLDASERPAAWGKP